MIDRREEILNSIIDNHPSHGLGEEEFCIAKDAMDEYMKECCLELLEYMAKNNVECLNGGINNPEDKRYFYYKREWITKEELFENFL